VRLRLPRLAVALALIALLTSSAFAQGLVRTKPAPPFVPGQLVVGFGRNAPASASLSVVKALGAMPGRRLPQIGAQVFHLPKADSPQAVAARVRKLPGVRYAEPNYRRRVLLLTAPDDPAYTTVDKAIAPFDYLEDGEATWFQWTLHNIEALKAWRVYPNTYYTQATKPPNAPKLAVIDTGIDIGGTDGIPHAEFINASGSSPDAAQGGQVDITDGRNVISGADPAEFEDDYGHGTAVSGTAAAAANNGPCYEGRGMAGLAYNAQIMPIKAFDNTGNGTDVDTAVGIIWAVDHGAVVVNISAGDYFYSQAEQDAVDYAWTHGTLVVAAAGNEGDSTNRPMWPAACDGVMGVAATTWYPWDTPASYSNFGYYVEVAAPAGDISYVPIAFWGTWCPVPTEYAPIKDGGWDPTTCFYYQYHFGTSLASPHAAALASLYAAYKGITQATPNAPLLIWKGICRGVEDTLGVPGWNSYVGWGKINAWHTLLEDNYRGSSVGGIRGQVLYLGTTAPNARVDAVLQGGGALPPATARSDGSYSFVNLTPGVYDLTATYQGHSQQLTGVQVEAGYNLPRVRFDIGGQSGHAPVLAWAGTGGYENDGVDPNVEKQGARFVWKVKYSDSNSDPPSDGVKVHILRNGGEIADSPFAMTTGTANDYKAGVTYRYARTLTWGDYSYWFEASDGASAATGEPTNEREGPEVLSPPRLANPAVRPGQGGATTVFRYSVDYSSADGKPAAWVQLQVNAYTPPTGWSITGFRKRGIASGTTVTWRKTLGQDFPGATQFKYRFRAGKGPSSLGIVRATEWKAGPNMTGVAAAMVSSLAAAPTRAGGAEIVFSLSAPADVTVRVLNLAGRPIREIRKPACAKGLNTAVWDGRGETGLSAPGGTYMVEVTAASKGGGQARALTMLRRQ
jgi:Subtilase family/Fervidolysin N-terminal prodomain/FlgD Ig-like domain/Carboxypeptidase regulatory-like domain